MDINGINYEENVEVSHLLPPGTMLRNQYRIESVLGEGGFGITYRATDTMLELPVAVKEFYPVGSNRVVKYSCSVSYKTGMTERYSVSKNRFLDEARMLAKCDSIPGIVRVLAYFEENNTAYIVMEFLDGVTLEKYVKDNGVMKAEELIPKMLPLIKSLSRVHEMDYIHRDISPNNIMLRPDGSLTLYDFGTAKEANYRDLHTMTTMQKVGFTPYEQLNSHGKQGSWTDVYALCGTMYYCLTGQIPPDAIDRVMDSALPMPKGITVPEEVWQVITAGMEPQTENRFQNMNALSKALGSTVMSAGTYARTAPATGQIKKAPADSPERKTEPENMPTAPYTGSTDEKQKKTNKTEYRTVDGEEELFKRGLDLLEKKDYKSALQIFESIAGYRNSKDYMALCQKEISKLENDTPNELPKPTPKPIKKPLVIAALIATVLAASLMIIPKHKYDTALALMSGAEYEEAIEIFETIKGYKDSEDQIENCRTAINDTAYKAALKLRNNADYMGAYEAFKQLDGYKDSEELADAIFYLYKTSLNLKDAEVGDIVAFGAYEQDNDTSNGKEDIEWIVLAREDNKILVTSRYALDCQPYNTDIYLDVTWETCTLRKWLNDSFLNTAFSSEEQKLIMQTAVHADPNPKYDTDPGNATEDKVFLLSINEVNEYFTNDEARKCTSTAYAKARGAWTGIGGTCWWWLRTPSDYLWEITHVQTDGSIYYEGYTHTHEDASVRPAIWIDIVS